MTTSPQLDPVTHCSGLQRRQVIVESTFVVLLIAAAFILRLWPLRIVHFWDETVYLQNAEVICCGKANYSELDSRPPLLSLIFATVFLLWHQVYAVSIATALLNALGPALLYIGGRTIAGRVPAAIASLLLAFLPFFVGVFPPGFMLALAVLIRFPSLSSVGVLSLLIFAADRWWRAGLACATGFAAGLGPYFCWSRFRYGGLLKTLRNGWGHFQGSGESPFFYLKNFGDIFSWITVAGLVLWIVRWAWESWRQKAGDHGVRMVEPTAGRPSRQLEAFLWLWAASLLLFFSVLRHKEPRYAIPLAPPLFLLAGIGLSMLLRGRQRAARVAGSIVLIAALAYTFLPVRQRFESPFIDDEVSEEMRVSDFLNHSVLPATVLYSNFNYPVFAYYTNLPVHRLLESGSTLYNELNRLPCDGILIAYRENTEIAEPRLEWLDSNPHFRRFREFPTLVLYEYRANASRQALP